MNRLGWILLALFAGAGALFWLMLDGSGGPRPVTADGAVALPAPPQRADPVGALLIPVAGVSAGSLSPTFEQERDGGRRWHGAIDIMAPRGTPVIAAMPGTVERLFTSEAGGITAYVRSDDGRWIGYYAHLDGYAAGLAEGQRLERGALIGTVGSSGNAEDDAPHLHFAIHRMRSSEAWSGGVPVDPYPLLTGQTAP